MPRPAKYPFADLDIGQAFTIPTDTVSYGTVNSLCVQWGKKLGRSFSFTTTEDGYLVERVELRTASAFEVTQAPTRRRYSTQAETRARVAEALQSLDETD